MVMAMRTGGDDTAALPSSASDNVASRDGVPADVNETTSSTPSGIQLPAGRKRRKRWTDTEREALIQAVGAHGRDWAAVAAAVGTRSKEDCQKRAHVEIKQGRLPEPEGKLNKWTEEERARLHRAVEEHGRDWVAVSKVVGTRSNVDCQKKADNEIKARKLSEPPGLREHRVWEKEETDLLYKAVREHGRDWIKVSKVVGTRSNDECQKKAYFEMKAGRLEELESKLNWWTPEERDALYRGVQEHGRDWVAVSKVVKTRTNEDCQKKAQWEMKSGRMPDLGGKLRIWSETESELLREAVRTHGRDWGTISSLIENRTRQECSDKARTEIKAGRLEAPAGKQEHNKWTKEECEALHRGIREHGRDWVAVSKFVKTRTNQECHCKAQKELKAGRLEDPGGKLKRWTDEETAALYDAVERYGRDWAAVSKVVGTRSSVVCQKKAHKEIKARRLADPGAISLNKRKEPSPVLPPLLDSSILTAPSLKRLRVDESGNAFAVSQLPQTVQGKENDGVDVNAVIDAGVNTIADLNENENENESGAEVSVEHVVGGNVSTIESKNGHQTESEKEGEKANKVANEDENKRMALEEEEGANAGTDANASGGRGVVAGADASVAKSEDLAALGAGEVGLDNKVSESGALPLQPLAELQQLDQAPSVSQGLPGDDALDPQALVPLESPSTSAVTPSLATAPTATSPRA